MKKLRSLYIHESLPVSASNLTEIVSGYISFGPPEPLYVVPVCKVKSTPSGCGFGKVPIYFNVTGSNNLIKALKT